MDYFSVNNQGMAEVIQTEQQLSNRLSALCDRLLACNTKAWGIGSLRDKKYHEKIWRIYSNTGNRQIDVHRMQQGLMKVCDAYRAYELQVLQQAEEIVTAKNGFSKKTVQQVKNTVNHYETDVKKNRLVKEKTFGNVLYDATVGQWKENWVQCGKTVEWIKKTRKDVGGYWSENIVGWLEEQGIAGPAIGALKKGFDALDGKLSSYEDVLLGVVKFPDTEALKKGAVSYVSAMTGDTDLEGIDKVLEGALDTLSPDSEVMQGYRQVTEQAAEAFQKGNYLEGAVLYFGGSANALSHGIVDTGANIAGDWADNLVKDASTWTTGEEITMVDALNGGESLLNEFAGWLNEARG